MPVISAATANHGSPGTANGFIRSITVAGGSVSYSSRVALIVARSRNGLASVVSAATARYNASPRGVSPLCTAIAAVSSWATAR